MESPSGCTPGVRAKIVGFDDCQTLAAMIGAIGPTEEFFRVNVCYIQTSTIVARYQMRILLLKYRP